MSTIADVTKLSFVLLRCKALVLQPEDPARIEPFALE